MASNRNQSTITDTAEQGSSLLTTSQVSVGASATPLLAANLGARARVLTNTHASATVFIGATSGVTTANGHPLAAGASMSITYTGTLYGITASATVTVGASEIYDPLP